MKATLPTLFAMKLSSDPMWSVRLCMKVPSPPAKGNAVKHLLSGTCVIPCSLVGPNPASGRVNQGLGTTQKRFSMLRPRPALRRGDEGLTTHRDQFSNPGSIGVNRLLIYVVFVSGKAPAAGESTAILVLLPAAGALPLTKSTS